MREYIKSQIQFTLIVVLVAVTALQFAQPHIETRGSARNFTLIVGSEDLGAFTGEWMDEVGRRYSDALVVFVHGDSDPRDQWYYRSRFDEDGGKVEDMLRALRLSNPNRRIVLVCCNPGGYNVTIPGVTYAASNVWLVPNSFQSAGKNFVRDALAGPATGDIFEFVETPF